MSILCSRDAQWFLAGSSGDPRWSGAFSIRVGPGMNRAPGFDWRNEPGYSHAIVQEGRRGEFQFFRELLFQRMRVHPEWWHFEAAEPLLHCRLRGDQITQKVGLLPEILRARAAADQSGDPADHESWRQLCMAAEKAAFALRAELVNEGWKDQSGDGLVKYLHVEELEKIEGPPPEGAF